MKKLKKTMAFAMAFVIGTSLCACSGAKKDEDVTEEAEKSEETQKKEEMQVKEDETVEDLSEDSSGISQEDGMPAEEGDILYVYSWNDEFADRLQFFQEKYPQYADRVEYVNLDVGANSGDYKTGLETLLQSHYEEVEKYPSIIALDHSIALDYVQSDYTLPLSELGIGEDDFKNMYPYTLDFATYENEVKALTWQATPGVVCYRADIAEWVFGSSEPEVVQDALSDWDKFLKTAEQMKEFGYKMVSGPDDVKFAFMDSATIPWVTDENLNIDQWVSGYLETAKKLHDEEYTSDTSVESAEWLANMDKDVFCYFGNPQFFYWTLDPETHAGDYNICEGPAPFHFGGTYLAVGNECHDKQLAALILRTLCCDTETMTKIGEETYDFVNNMEAIQVLIADGKGIAERKGDFNPLPTFDAVAKKVDVSNATVYDTKFNGYVDHVLADYLTDKKVDTKEAIERVKDQVSDAYNYIKIK